MYNDEILKARESYYDFILKSRINNYEFQITPNSEVTPFALCFALFGLNLIGKINLQKIDADICAHTLRSGLLAYRDKRPTLTDLRFDKPFLQLLTFTLSSLYLINKIRDMPLDDIIPQLLVNDIDEYLERIGSLRGVPQSGNLSMFMAILLIHARDYIGINTNPQMEQWVALHLNSMNQYGFWGNERGMSYLQFQNGYHQYEIFEYLDIDHPFTEVAAENISSLTDHQGHFAPYPGGGGCYDYDAVFIITSTKKMVRDHHSLLKKTAKTILSEQNPDGGFGESHNVRPRSLKNIMASIHHLLFCNRKWEKAHLERLRYWITLQRPKHNRIHNHWSIYSREWNESNLWDSWFRMLAIARIQCALNINNIKDWGFINYPGIGYHRALRDSLSKE